MAHYYPKIYAPFARNSSSDKYVDTTKWSKPEFEILKDIDWCWTAKADGTNIRVFWNGDKVEFYGHTDRSQLSEKTLKYLNAVFGTPEAESVFEDLYGSQPVNIYGEFCSREMNEDYGHPDGIFYPFDVQNAENGQWWNRECVHELAKKFGLKETPMVFRGTIAEAVEYVSIAEKGWNKDSKDSFYKASSFGGYKVYCPYADNAPLEGLVGRPFMEMQNGKGERVICKVKCKDFSPDKKKDFSPDKKYEAHDCIWLVKDTKENCYSAFSKSLDAHNFLSKIMDAFPGTSFYVFKQDTDELNGMSVSKIKEKFTEKVSKFSEKKF